MKKQSKTVVIGDELEAAFRGEIESSEGRSVTLAAIRLIIAQGIAHVPYPHAVLNGVMDSDLPIAKDDVDALIAEFGGDMDVRAFLD